MIIHKFKTIFQKRTNLVHIETACGEIIDCRKGAIDYAQTSVDWKDVTCKLCLKNGDKK